MNSRLIQVMVAKFLVLNFGFASILTNLVHQVGQEDA